MLFLRSNIIGSPIIDFRTQDELGRVSEVIFDDTLPRIIGFATQNQWTGKVRVVKVENITEFNRQELIIDDIESLINLTDNKELSSLVKRKCYGIKQKVKTESDKSLGTVHDFVIEDGSFGISRYYVKNLFYDFILPDIAIKKITPKIITISDNYHLTKSKLNK